MLNHRDEKAAPEDPANDSHAPAGNGRRIEVQPAGSPCARQHRKPMTTNTDNPTGGLQGGGNAGIPCKPLDGVTCEFEETAGPPAGGSKVRIPAGCDKEIYRKLLASETAPMSTNREWLRRRGWIFPEPAKLSGLQVKEELWRLIRALEKARLFIENTDHLSDAELYARLWHDVLDAEEPDLPRSKAEAWHWDLADPTAGHEVEWLTYYASEDDREMWKEEYPDFDLPEHRDPPYERDDAMPKWRW